MDTPILTEYITVTGRKIDVNISDESLSLWGLKHGQNIVTNCGCETTVAGVALCGGKGCGKLACNIYRLWLLNTDSRIRYVIPTSREGLIHAGYEIIG